MAGDSGGMGAGEGRTTAGDSGGMGIGDGRAIRGGGVCIVGPKPRGIGTTGDRIGGGTENSLTGVTGGLTLVCGDDWAPSRGRP